MVKEVNIIGGEFHHNGQLGQSGTGYEITCSAQVGVLNIDKAKFYRNYRKGFDTHGCINVNVNNVVCKDNVIFHFAILNWSSIMPEGSIQINNIVLSNGYSKEDRDWLNEAYNALSPLNTSQKPGSLFTINDNKEDGTASTNLIKNITINNMKVLANYNGHNLYGNLNTYIINILAKESVLNLNDWALNLQGEPRTPSTVYLASLCQIQAKEMHLNRVTAKNIPNMIYGTGGTKRGAFFLASPSIIRFNNVRFEGLTGYLFGVTSSGEIAANSGLDNNTKRLFHDCYFEWSDFPPVPMTDTRLFGYVAATTNTSHLSFRNTQIKTPNSYFKMPDRLGTDFETPFVKTNTSSISNGGVIVEFILEKVYNSTFEFSLNGLGTLIVSNDSSTQASLVILQDNVKYGIGTMAHFVDTDGVERT
jgi:hypothetical protein